MSEYYAPPVSDSTEIIQGLETVAVRLKEESVVKYLSQTIYSSWTSALRELYANELTAAKKARREYKAEPTIELRLDPETRELIIWGRESLGITGEKLKILRYYGRSGNFSGEDAGQFGFGFKSYTLLSDEIRVETYARETRERYGFIGVRGVELRPLKDEELTIGEHGTKVSIVIRGSQGESLGDGEGKEIRLGKVIESLQEVCRFAEIDTYLVLTSPLKRKVQHSFRFSAQEEYYFETEKEAGREKLNHTPKEYAKIVHGANGYDFELETADFHFYGFLALYGESEALKTSGIGSGEVRLVGMPIEASVTAEAKEGTSNHPEKPTYPLSFWFVNLKDERKFTPTADRERLREGSFDVVHGRVREYLRARFASMEVRSFEEYRNSRFRPILNSAREEKGIRELLTPETLRVCDALATEVGALDEDSRQEEDDGVGVGDPRHERRRSRWTSSYAPAGVVDARLRDVVVKSRRIFMVSRKQKADGNGFFAPVKTAHTLRKILRAKYADAEVFMHPGYASPWARQDFRSVEQSRKDMMEQFGILDAKVEADKVRRELGPDWRTAAGVSRRMVKEPKREATVWTRAESGCLVEPMRRSSDDVGDDTVRVRGNIKGWVELLREYRVIGVSFTKDVGVRGGGMSEEQFASKASATRVFTREGLKTIGEVVKASTKPILLLHFEDEQLLDYYRPKSRLAALATSDESAFGAVAYLRLVGREHEVTRSIPEGHAGTTKSRDGRRDVDHLSDPTRANYMFIAKKRLGKSADPTLLRLLRDAIENADGGRQELTSLIEAAEKYAQFVNVDQAAQP